MVLFLCVLSPVSLKYFQTMISFSPCHYKILYHYQFVLFLSEKLMRTPSVWSMETTSPFSWKNYILKAALSIRRDSSVCENSEGIFLRRSLYVNRCGNSATRSATDKARRLAATRIEIIGKSASRVGNAERSCKADPDRKSTV